MNYSKIRLTLKDRTQVYISEEELVIFKLSGKYLYIEYLNKKGKLHRTDGPAIELANGRKEWYVEGKLNTKNAQSL